MDAADMSAWRIAWRFGIAPDESISTFSLFQLREAVEGVDPSLVFGDITVPDRVERELPTGYTRDPLCVGACPVAFMLWRGLGLSRCREIEHHFRLLAKRANARLAQLDIHPAPWFGAFTVWWDKQERTRQGLLFEINLEIKRREKHGQS